MTVTEDTVGPWRVRAEWDDQVSRNGPSRVVIEPDPTADPELLGGGISTTVLRKVKPTRPVEPRDNALAVELLRKLAQRHEVTDEYLAALSAVYATLTATGSPRVSHELAELVDRAPSTVKAQLSEARRIGLLTKAVPHRAGGELTERANELLQQAAREARRILHENSSSSLD